MSTKKVFTVSGFFFWNGAAIAKFVGQGRLYILQSHVYHMLNTIVIMLQS